MTLQLKPGHNLSDEELIELETLIQQRYPGEDVLLVYDEEPMPGYAYAPAEEPYDPPNILTRLVVAAITVVAALYLANPTAGVLELIPDIVPVVGNLDEATALALVISGLSFFGVNVRWLTAIFGRGLPKNKRRE